MNKKTINITFEIEGTSIPNLLENEKKINEFLSNKNALKKFFEKYNFLKSFI